MEEGNLVVFLKTNAISSQNLFQCDICDYCCFQVVIKTHEKQTWRRETSQFILIHTLAIHFVKKLFQCDICDYCCFQVVIKTHEKQTWKRKPHGFSQNTFQQFIFVKNHLKNKHGGEKPHGFSKNTHYQTTWLALMTHFLSVQYVIKRNSWAVSNL